jgi:hypothetical protein
MNRAACSVASLTRAPSAAMTTTFQDQGSCLFACVEKETVDTVRDVIGITNAPLARGTWSRMQGP